MFKRQEPIELKNKWKFHSYIGRNTSWWHYYGQYKSVIDELVNGIEKEEIPIDTVSLPLLFLIRHSLEVGLKGNILKLEMVNPGISKLKLTSHSIKFLYERFVEHLRAIRKSHKISRPIALGIDDYLQKFEPLKDKLHILDESSTNFRYPVNKDGKLNFDWMLEENVADIINAYYEIQPFLVFTDAVLHEEGIFGLDGQGNYY